MKICVLVLFMILLTSMNLAHCNTLNQQVNPFNSPDMPEVGRSGEQQISTHYQTDELDNEEDLDDEDDNEEELNSVLDINGRANLNVASNVIRIGIEYSIVTQTVTEGLNEIKYRVKNAIKQILSKGCLKEHIASVYYAIIPYYNEHMFCESFKTTTILEITIFSKILAGKVIDSVIHNGAILHWVNWDVTDKQENEHKPKLISMAVHDAIYKAKKAVGKMGYQIKHISYLKLNEHKNQEFQRLAPTSQLYGVHKSLSYSVDMGFNIELNGHHKIKEN
jgi:uncharacterized protein YggE